MTNREHVLKVLRIAQARLAYRRQFLADKLANDPHIDIHDGFYRKMWTREVKDCELHVLALLDELWGAQERERLLAAQDGSFTQWVYWNYIHNPGLSL